jgi:hypothetical protein
MKIGKSWQIGLQDYSDVKTLFIEHRLANGLMRGLTLAYLLKHPLSGYRWLTGKSVP